MPTIYLFAVLVSFITALFCTFLLRKFVLRNKLFISQRTGLPLIGGIGLASSFIAACISSFFLYGTMPFSLIGVIVSSSIMLIFGIVDDWKELSVRTKFIMQIIAASALILFGIRTRIVYIGGMANSIITFIFVIGITNAFNHLDVMDGLAGGVAAITCSAFFMVAFLNRDVTSGIVSLALLGVVLGFMAYNLPPARVYMGNAGSHFLGFVLAAIALNISYAPLGREAALLSPLLILGFAIFDTAFLILIRIRKKKSPFKKSDDHLVLRFLKSGLSKKESLSSMLILALFFSVSGVFLSKASNFLGVIIIAAVIATAAAVAYKMGRVRIDG